MQQNTETVSFISLFPWETGRVKPLIETSISSFRAPSLSESALKTYLFREKKGGKEGEREVEVEETFLNILL